MMRRVAAGISVLGMMMVGTASMAPAASAGPKGFDKAYVPDPSTPNTFANSPATLTPQCPNAIVDTPGSNPATKKLNVSLNQAGNNFQVGGTVHYVYLDNTTVPVSNFTVQDCEVMYPAGFFPAGSIDPSTGLVTGNFTQQQLDSGTAIDGADLGGFTDSTQQMYFGWNVHGVTPGEFVCNFARDNSNQHAGTGNRKAQPVCFEVQAPFSPLSLTVVKTNNAANTGFAKSTTSTGAGENVPFKAVITNTSTVAVTIGSIQDAYGVTDSPECADLIGTTLAAGASTTCTFTINGYAPPAGQSLTDTVTVGVSQQYRPSNTASAHDTSTVTTPAGECVADCPQPPALSLTVAKTNDAAHTGFAKSTTSTGVGEGVQFQVVITNTSTVAVKIGSIQDAYGVTDSPECAGLIGTALAAGAHTTCTFTINGYAPPAGQSLTDTVTVGVSQSDNSSNTTSAHDTSTVETPPLPALSLTVAKTNDAAHTGFAKSTTSTGAGEDVQFQVVITNTSTVAVKIGSIQDAYGTANSPECANLVGTTLAAGAHTTCTFTINGYAPPAGQSLTDTVTVGVSQPDNSSNTASAQDTSTVSTPAPQGCGSDCPPPPCPNGCSTPTPTSTTAPPTTTPPTTSTTKAPTPQVLPEVATTVAPTTTTTVPPTTTTAPPQARVLPETASRTLPFTGTNVRLLLLAGLGLILVGLGLMAGTWRQTGARHYRS